MPTMLAGPCANDLMGVTNEHNHKETAQVCVLGFAKVHYNDTMGDPLIDEIVAVLEKVT